jgi:membrane protein
MRAFVTEVLAIWNAERPTQLAAALAYYGMFALAPLLIIAFGLAGLFIDALSAADRLSERLAVVLGPQAIESIQALVASQARPGTHGSRLATIIGILALLYAASGLFYQLKYVLNRIWRVPYSSRGAASKLIRDQLLSFLMVLSVALLLIVVTVVNIVIAWLGDFLQRVLGIGDATVVITILATIALLTLSFSLLYTVLPDVHIRWRDSLPGAFTAALMMILAAILIGLFFQLTNATTAFAAAGSVAFLMVGINYLAQIFLFGAVITRAYASHYGASPRDPNITAPKDPTFEPTQPQDG